MTNTIIFNAAQAQLDNGDTGVQLAQVILPYSIRNSEDPTKYLGGQMTLFPSDGIKLSDNTKDWERLGLVKIKEMVADAEIYLPDPIVEAPEELPESSATGAPVSSADDSSVSSESMASNSTDDSVASSEATVESPASTQETPVISEPVVE